ncbi:hypothetical protein N7509_014240 [Penicillium cosmopolitanum]|uniref:F-box domain-containing protein n=1 Tax=Penicillium cosmopolitanum TaxID=1131564 RepID=A0A9W9S4W1_9EURO|nr:uncharacterized protein N7509_014240 [Penicillium cosmopolitanum]KAJ5369628.1 hypothetical protein N7509_014240 [Penicillium cosmopolitanum]
MVAEFDTFCAICSCSLHGGDIGSDVPHILKLRRGRVARRKYWLERELPYDETEDEDEEGRQERKRYMVQVLDPGDELLNDTDEDDANSVLSEDYAHSYDPGILGADGLDWLSSTYGVGIDHRRSGPKSYSVSDLDDPPVFPFHWDCLQLLSRAITGSPDSDQLQKETLYRAMQDIGGFTRLDLDYGDFHGDDQDWQNIPGEEVTVLTNMDQYSVLCPTISVHLGFHIPDNVTMNHSTQSDLSAKVIHDPFGHLPYDVTSLIVGYLCGDAVLALCQASWLVCATTRHGAFWKQRIQRDMAWCWEVQELKDDRSKEVDYKQMYLWLESKTRTKYGLTGPFLPLVNRRRIWRCCEEIADRYRQVQAQN